MSIRTIMHRLVEPHLDIVDPAHRQAARAVMIVTLSLLLLNTIVAVVYTISTRSVSPHALAAETVFLSAYLLSRGLHPAWGSGVVVVCLSAMVFVLMPGSGSPSIGFLWLIIPFTTAAIVLPMHAATAVVVLNVIGVVVYDVLDPTASLWQPATPILVTVFAALLALGSRYIRERDASVLKRQARELAESRERYRSLFDDVPIGLYETTPAGRVVDANLACVELLGFVDREAFLCANTPDLYVDVEQRERWRAVVDRKGSVRDFESQLRKPDGTTIWVRESARAIRDADGQVLSYRGSIEDVTESKLAQAELVGLASVIEQSSETVVMTDLDGNIIYANPAFQRTSGYSVAEALGKNSRILKSGHQDQAFYRELWETITAGEIWNGGFVNRRKDGSLYHEEATILPLKDVQGKTINYAAVKRDVTEGVYARERLEQRNLELATLNALAQALASSLELGDMLDEALSRVLHSQDYAGGLISRVNPRTGDLEIASYAGLPLPFVERLETMGLGGTVCDRAYRERKQLICEDLAQTRLEGVSELLSMGFRFCVGTPILHQGDVVGALCLFDVAPRQMPETEQMLLMAIGQQIGVATERARLFGETQQRVRELQLLHDVSLAAAVGLHLEETERAATTSLAGALPGASVALLLMDPGSDALCIQASTGYPADTVSDLRIRVGDGITGWVAQHGQSALVPDVRQDPRYLEIADDTRSELCVPLTVGSQVIGVLNVESPQVGAFMADDQRLLGVLANSLAVLIERARLFDQVQSARAELQSRAEELTKANARLEELAQVKSEFLAHMSHELRTPLTAILGFSQLMLRSPSLPADHRENLQMIHSSGEHLLDLINDVLDMAKIESGRITFDPTDLDLEIMIHNVLSMMNERAEEKGLALSYDRAPDVPRHVRTDERKLRQVLLNLLSNALKFTEEGGVTLRVRSVEQGAQSTEMAFPAASTPSPCCVLHFEVEDTGAGIAPEEMDKLFESFAQTSSGKRSQGGTGLGLPICRKFVQVMGGNLTVSSEVGRGSTFAFEVPVDLADMGDAAARHAAHHIVGLESGQQTYRVLIADDRLQNRILVRQLLESIGFEVEEAANGKEAVDLHQRWHPHLVLMDMRMPVMDGYEAAQRIRASAGGKATIIVALTASALEEEREAILSAGCDDYVRKPFHDADLLATLGQHLGVRYRLADQDEAATDTDAGPAQEALTPCSLAVLPVETVAELHDAASRARADLIQELAARIAQDHPLLSRGLVQLVDEFRFDKIMALTEQQEGAQ